MDKAQQRLVYSNHNWKIVSYQCKVRAGFRCETCSRVGRLESHHIFPLSRMVYGDPRAFDPSNIKVLCKPCHHSAHKYKAPNVSRKAWMEYVDALTN